MGGGVDGSETSSGGAVPSGWSASSSLVGSSHAAVVVAGSVAVSGGSDESVALASRGGGGGRRSSAPAVAWSRIPDSRVFPQEVWKRGEPQMRPERGRVVIARTAGMAAREQDFRGRVLYATIIGQPRSVVTPEALAAAMESQCAVRRTATKVEVTGPPFNFFVRFDSQEDCTRVVHASKQLRCGGTRIAFQRWSSFSHGTPGKLVCCCRFGYCQFGCCNVGC
jgi:hypothetical protein